LTNDPVANSNSRTLTPTMYLPGLGGMTDVPMLVAPLAGLSINPPGSKFTFATNVYTPQALGYSRIRTAIRRATTGVGYRCSD
jgi:long-subunit fatty acid transport protein